MQNFDDTGLATILMIKRLLADDYCVRTFEKIATQLTGNLEQDFAVALILGGLIINITCLLYRYLLPTLVVAENCKPRAAERKVTGNNVCICLH